MSSATVVGTLFVLAANSQDAHDYAQILGEMNGDMGAVQTWLRRVRVYDESATDAQIEAGTATVIGYVESGGMPEWLWSAFAEYQFEAEAP
jgi:hypothetical protein